MIVMRFLWWLKNTLSLAKVKAPPVFPLSASF